MAFDAAIPAVPPQAPSGKGNSAAAQPASGETNPFAALMALVGNNDAPAQESQAAPATQAPTPVKDAEPAAPQGEQDMAEQDDVAEQDQAEPAAEAVADPALLLAAALMVQQPAQPVETAPAAAAPVQTPAPAAVPIQTQMPLPQAAAPPAKIEAAADQAEILPMPAASVEAQAVDAAAIELPKTVETAPAAPAVAAPSEQLATGDVRRAETGDKQATAANASAQAASGGAAQSDSGQAGERSSDERAAQVVVEAKPAAADAAAKGVDAAAFTPVADAAPAAPASPAVAPAAPAPIETPIVAQAAAVPVRGAPETVAHLAAQMIQRLDGQSTRFDLTLNPQSLGRVDVRIEIDRHGALKARMGFSNPEAAQELGSRQAELRAALTSAGFDIADGDISFDVASGGEGGQNEFADQNFGSGRQFNAVAEAADQPPAASPYFNRTGASGVDIRV